jgi:hypothetical protein
MEMDELLRKVREEDATEDALETPDQTVCIHGQLRHRLWHAAWYREIAGILE